MRSTSQPSTPRRYENMDFFRATDSGDVEIMTSLLNNKLSFMQTDSKGFTPLLRACTLGKVYTEVYKAKKKLYGEKLGEGEAMSALHFACYARDRNFVRKLLESGADINERIPGNCPIWSGYTPLHLCIEFKFENVARMLLGRGADVHIVSPNGLTPIFMSENNGLRDLTAGMLRKYTSWTINPIDKKSGDSYLHLASKYGLVEVAEALLHHGANVNIQNDATPEQMDKYIRRRCTPLHMAKDVSIVKILLSYGANLDMKDSFGDTPLHRAFYENNDEVVEAIFQGHSQCRANPADRSGISHLHIACMRGFKDAISSILEHNFADIYESTIRQHSKWAGYSPLHFAVEHGSVEVVQLLLDHGAPLEVINKYGWTPLLLAVYLRDNTSIAQMLLDAGAKINTQGLKPFGGTALHVAAQLEHTNHVALLLERGANPNAIGYWWTPLHVACQKLNVDIVKLLLEHGADPNAKQLEENTTPLHVCVKVDGDTNSNDNRHGHIISFLIEAGAKLNTYDSKGLKPIHHAAGSKDQRPLRALLYYSTDAQLGEIISRILSIHIGRPNLSIEPFLEHLEVLNHINPSDVASHGNDLFKRLHEADLYSEDTVISVRNACSKDIEVLREMGLDFCLSYTNIFTKNAIEVARLWQRSEKLVELVETNELRQFPMYGDRLRRCYEDLQRAPSRLEQALVLVNTHWNLDHDSAESIFRYLKPKELEALVKAFEF